jgi:hypothetical protein
VFTPFPTRCLLFALALLLAGCGSIDPQVYRNERPALDLQRYFNGTLEGHGMFQDRSGQVQRRFVVTIKASWEGGVGTLDEDFVWSDGKREKRIWTLRRAPGDTTGTRWIGTAADVIGEAQGLVSGNALNWTYRFDLTTEDGRRYEVAFDDWMFLVDDSVMLNRAVMRWYGVRIGEVFISFRRL